jgi:hypothetical protein
MLTTTSASAIIIAGVLIALVGVALGMRTPRPARMATSVRASRMDAGAVVLLIGVVGVFVGIGDLAFVLFSIP